MEMCYLHNESKVNTVCSVRVVSCVLEVSEVIYQTRTTVFHHISNPEKKVKTTTRSGVFLTNFEVFGNMINPASSV